MIVTLIAGFCVGVFFGQASVRIGDLLAKAGITLGAEEITLASFALCLAGVAMILLLIGVDSYPVLLCLSAAIGVARKPLLARITGK
ncbi:hypothetical protein [Planktotalea arctica]|uniref:hypothetical protein n=1 Tax=Planktotalea arctica TaxID=1481893 RepID=UPI000A174B45|nr:hypothetical protein [Planktotalea arctica]